MFICVSRISEKLSQNSSFFVHLDYLSRTREINVMETSSSLLLLGYFKESVFPLKTIRFLDNNKENHNFEIFYNKKVKTKKM